MYGWAGTILRVDLSRGEIAKHPLPPNFARKWLGGEGFGAKLLWDEVGPEVEDGLDPRNLLIYTSGPLTSTLAPAAGRLEIVTKSPLTGIFGDSNAGGHFAPAFKQAGYDVIAITGRAERPVYLWIDDEQVQIRDASHLWGKTVPETDELIKEELQDRNIQISCIGPAGENKVRFAILMNNLYRAPGWTGCGAVAGSKNLKAVAVRGTRGVRIAHPEEFEQACWEAREKLEKHFPLFQTLRHTGTNYLFAPFYQGGFAHLNNYNIAQCSESQYEEISPAKWTRFIVQANGCAGCTVHCHHYAVIREGPYRGIACGAYDFGGSQAFLNWYGSTNHAFAIAAIQYCNENGIDCSEPGMLLAWATDCFQRGIITREDTDGLVLDWGDEKLALELLRKMVYREGFGDLLAEGLARAARKMGRGTEEYAYTIKGRPSVEGNVRASYGCAIASVTSTRGGDHLKGWPHLEFVAPSPERAKKYWGHPKACDGTSHLGKARMTVYGQSNQTLMDILGTCKYHSSPPLAPITEEDYARMVSAATGVEFTTQELMKVAERVYNLEQAYNVRLGLGRKDDTLPETYFSKPLDRGPLEGFVIRKKYFEKMLDEYYALRGWDVETGVPTRETLEDLDLKDVADELEGRVNSKYP